MTEARRAVGEHLRELSVAKEQRDAVQIGLSEAVANVVRHAYPSDTQGELEVEIGADPDLLHVQVRDWGCGRNEARAETAGAGFGMPLMQSVSQEFAIADGNPRGTEVRMTFPRA